MIERQKSAPITYSVFKHPDPKTQGAGAKNLETSAPFFKGWGQKPFGDTLILAENKLDLFVGIFSTSME